MPTSDSSPGSALTPAPRWLCSLRLAGLTSKSLYLDESFSAFVMRQPVGGLLERVAHDPNAVFFYAFVQASARVL